MSGLVRAEALPSSGTSKVFEGKDHGSEISCFLVDGPPGHGPRLHRHPYEEVFVVRSGSGTFTLGDDQVKAAAGDIVVAPAGTAHRFANTGSERLQLVAIHRSAEFVTDWLE